MIVFAVCLALAGLLGPFSVDNPIRSDDSSSSGDVIVRLSGQNGHPGLVATGYLEFRKSKDKAVASEIEVFREGRKTPLLRFDALQTCIVERRGNLLLITELTRWPFGRDWTWKDVPFQEYSVFLDPSEKLVKRMVLKPPRMTKAQCREAVALYEQFTQPTTAVGRAIDVEDVVGRLLVAALGGCGEAEITLLMLPGHCRLDGAFGEIYEEAVECYRTYRLSPREQILPIENTSTSGAKCPVLNCPKPIDGKRECQAMDGSGFKRSW
jgi:hypothetical protein